MGSNILTRRACSFGLIFALALNAVPQPAAAAAPHQTIKLVTINKQLGLEEYKLGNGLTVLLGQRTAAPVVTVNMVYRVGSRNEAVGYTGATHFLEHMMFKGTNKFDPLKRHGLDDVLKKVGGINNATTSYDRTNYYEVVPKDSLALCLDLEADRMRHLLLRESDRQAEMTVVRNELERGEDEPAQLIEQLTFATAFREHPYHHPVIGWRSDVEGVPTSRLRKFYEDFYWPNNATLVVIGDFNKAEALKMIVEKFSAIPSARAPLPPVYTVEPPQEGERRFVVSRGKDLARVMIAFHTPRGLDRATFPLDVLAKVLGGNRKSSRLYKRLVETGLASECYAINYTLKDPGLFMVSATLQPGVDPNKVEDAIEDELKKVVAEKITAAELSQAISALSKGFRLSLSDPMMLAQSLTEGIAVGSWTWWAAYPQTITTVSAAEVQLAAKRFLQENNRTVGYYMPKDYKIADSQPADNVNTIPSAQVVETVQPTETKKAPVKRAATWQERVERVKLPNGLTALLAPVSSGALRGTVAVAGKLRAGDYFAPAGKTALADLTAELLSYGTAHFNKEEIASQLDQMGASLEFENGTFFHDFDTEVTAEDLPRMLKLLASEIKEPLFKEEDFALVKKLSAASLQEKMVDTAEVAWNKLTAELYKPGTVYYSPSFEKQIEELNNISLDEVKSYHKKYYTPNNMVIAFIGDFDPTELESQLKANFGDWPAGETTTIKVDEGVVRTEGRNNTVSCPLPDKANVDIAIGKPVATSLKAPDYLAAMIGNAVLGYDSFACRLAPVRDRLGLTYSISSRISEPHYPYSPWSIDLSVNPANVDRSIQVVDKLVNDFASGGITQAELVNEQSHLAGVYQVGLRSYRAMARKLADYEQLGLPVSYMDSFGSRVGKVNLKEVNEAVRRYFTLKGATTARAGTFTSNK